MKLFIFGTLLLATHFVFALDLETLQNIGDIKEATQTENGIRIVCEDKSEVQITALTADLVRIRASFRKSLPEKDHSWAIEKKTWPASKWKLLSNPTEIVFKSDVLKIQIQKKPFLIEFREAKSGNLIQADFSPMRFDPDKGTVAAFKKFGFNEHFYGLGEKAARLDKRRGSFTMWNSDTPGYVEGRDPIYQSIPFYLGLDSGKAYGVFFDNSYKTSFDFGASSQNYASFSSEGGELNYYFFYGPSLKTIVSRYTELTGRPFMPPKWALGNQQSRWSYYPDSVVEKVVDAYRKNDLPLDVIHLDIDYMDGYRVFTWDKTRFPDPKGLITRLQKKGVKTVTIIDPGVKHDPKSNYSVFKEGIEKDFFLKRQDKSVYIGKVWPGESVFVDYTKDAARNWWGDLHQVLTNAGVAGIWNDMNEPADFFDQTGERQKDVVSEDGGENSLHAKNRNVFGMLMSRATHEGLSRLRPKQRPYVITRAGYAGVQRYSTMWTGDGVTSWESLALSIPMFQTLGLSGESFVGADIPGFQNARASGELAARWYQVGFLAPFCRNHQIRDGYDHEPFRYPKLYQDIVRKYLKLRYRLMPFLYTLLEESHRTGLPLFRPLVLNYQTDPNVVGLDDEFILGEDLLAAPILSAGKEQRLVYLPEGEWLDFWTHKRFKGGQFITAVAPLETTPLYLRAGSIVPMGPEMNFIGEKASDPLTLVISLDASGKATGSLYEDDGESLDYQSGKFSRIDFSAQRKNGNLTIQANVSGDYPFQKRTVLVEVDGKKKTLQWNGKTGPLR